MATISGSVLVDPEKAKVERVQSEPGLNAGTASQDQKMVQSALAKETIQAKKELSKLETGIKKEVFQAKGMWPFDFFPDKIIIDLTTVTIIKRHLLSRYVFPLHIEDIKTVRDSWGPFFASLEIEVVGYEQNPPTLSFLPHSDATRARNYIYTLKALKKQGVNLENLSIEEITKKLEEITNVQVSREPGMI